ncbi:MAG: hypothetical protein HZA14_02745 [Nitrospirae bacterium]|nr:hypothetical protein [Nitrospirota bacterium]
MSVKDQSGKVVFSETKEYIVNDFYVNSMDPKSDPIMLPVWEYDRQVHVHEGIEPGETDSNTFVIPLKEGTKSVDVEAAFKFIHEKDKQDVWTKCNKKIEF